MPSLEAHPLYLGESRSQDNRDSMRSARVGELGESVKLLLRLSRFESYLRNLQLAELHLRNYRSHDLKD
jgi:hypothetical protein